MLYMYIYIIHHTWKKVGILPTCCRRQGAKNAPKNHKKQCKIAKTNPILKDLAQTVSVIFGLLALMKIFSKYDIHIYLVILLGWYLG